MLDSVIKKVEQHAALDGCLGNLIFANCHGKLFAWNDKVDGDYDENLLVEELAPFSEIPAEFPGVELGRDIPATSNPVINKANIPGVAEDYI